MSNFEYPPQSPFVDFLTIKSEKGDTEALFHLGKILWKLHKNNDAVFYLNEASKRGQIEAEQFLNTRIQG